MQRKILILLLACFAQIALAQSERRTNSNDMNSSGGMGNQYSESGLNRQSDTLHAKQDFPKGLKVWTVDRYFGDRIDAEPDTLSHLFQNSIFTNGLYGEYNNLGNVGSPRINRIFIDRFVGDDFVFSHPYDFFLTQPDEFLFTNTLSPITNISFNTCGSGNTGEDHLKALFAVNAGKKIGLGMKFDYIYGKGYYQNASTAHFNYSIYGSYIGDRYNAHALVSLNHQKVAESGGITDDEYIKHPESFNDNYSEAEIPSVLSRNWNRNDNQKIFFSQRYNVGFNRKVPMNEQEIAAKKFAHKAKVENDAKRALAKAKMEQGEDFDLDDYNKELAAKKASGEFVEEKLDTTWLKNEYVPVTSFIHTLNFANYKRIYQAYASPEGYYANTYLPTYGNGTYGNDSIRDITKHFCLKNNFAIAMLEGFNKWVPMGLKLFASHELRSYVLPDEEGWLKRENENHITLGGQLQKSLGNMFHYNVQLETFVVGPTAGDLYLDADGDMNFSLFGDTVSLQAKAFFHRETPSFYYGKYHSKHYWWDNEGDDELAIQTHSHVEGLLNIGKTKTKLRVAYDNLDGFTYFANSYSIEPKSFLRKNYDVKVRQSGNISLLTAQLMQDFKIGPVNLETVLTYQNSSDQAAVAVPEFNAYANLYLKFRIAKVLDTELGADARYFTSYVAPDYNPTLGLYCSQENGDNNIKVGNYPIINVYANFHLKHARFFVMMSHVNQTAGNYFLAPHYPQNSSLIRFGVSWNFFN
ncbi:MAG: putative porin [Bacteroidaceae bacterium]|nr:putative porin [Bacteroidaceae bacterium]